MRTVQLMKKKYIYVFCVYHIRIIAKKYWFTRHETDRFLSIWNMAVSLLSYSCMFQVEICSQQLEICKSVCMFIVLAIVVETD
jgi:hypothetical protein